MILRKEIRNLGSHGSHGWHPKELLECLDSPVFQSVRSRVIGSTGRGMNLVLFHESLKLGAVGDPVSNTIRSGRLCGANSVLRVLMVDMDIAFLYP